MLKLNILYIIWEMMKMKTKFKGKLLSVIVCIAIFVSCIPLTVFATTEDDIAILYTNDVHTYIDGSLSYDVIAAIKADLQTKYAHVLLADAGDHVQGTAYGSMDKGQSIVKMMNAAGYDVATLGNHEFDYGMQGCMNVIDWADYDYISCNFYHETAGVRGENVLDSYKIFDCGEEKVAFVGITTPETFSKSTPAYFQDGSGNFIYGISGGTDGSALYADIQNAIDAAKADGATKIIGLGHLGLDASSGPWTSEAAIENVTGLDAFIDGHSHSVVEGKNVPDKAGKNVVLTQTGEYFNSIGMMVIDSETGEITTNLIEYGEVENLSDSTVKAIKDAWLSEIDAQLGQKIGKANVTLDNYDKNGNRLVRGQSTNTGDFSADALYYLFDDMGLDVDVAIMNGGGIRNTAITGDLTYKICKDIHTFGNVACLQTVTGQQILDMLEWGARHVGESEDGSFLHVSGITFKIDTTIPNTTKADAMDVWIGGPDTYRVSDVMVYNKETNSWEALDINAKYNLAGYNYTLRDLGGGFAMLNGAENVLDYVMEDYMVLATYIKGFENGVVDAKNSPLLAKYPQMLLDYSDVDGSGRIEIVRPSIWVGGEKITAENAADVFGDGKVSYDFLTNTLTLKDYTYEGEGYFYGNNRIFSAAVYCDASLNIKLIGNNMLINTFNDSEALLWGDGIYVDGSLSVTGENDASIHVEGACGFAVGESFSAEGCVLDVDATESAILVMGDTLVIEDATVFIVCKYDGLTAPGDIIICDSTIVIDAQCNGIVSMDGKVSIESTSVKVSGISPSLLGTTIDIKSGGEYAIVAMTGIFIDGKLFISSPENASVEEIYDEVDDFSFCTILAGEDYAKEVRIKPIACYVRIRGLNNDMQAIVPIGQSLNEAYCEMFGIEDFSKVLNTEKEGYVFDGWYTDEAFTDGNEFDFDVKINEDTTIYAKWTVREQTSDEPETPDNTDVPDKPTENPETDDYSDVKVWYSILLISGVGIFCATVYDRKRRAENNK